MPVFVVGARYWLVFYLAFQIKVGTTMERVIGLQRLCYAEGIETFNWTIREDFEQGDSDGLAFNRSFIDVSSTLQWELTQGGLTGDTVLLYPYACIIMF